MLIHIIEGHALRLKIIMQTPYARLLKIIMQTPHARLFSQKTMLLDFNSSSSTSGSVGSFNHGPGAKPAIQKIMLKILRPYSCTFTSPHLAASLARLALLLIQLLQFKLIQVSYLKMVRLRSFIV